MSLLNCIDVMVSLGQQIVHSPAAAAHHCSTSLYLEMFLQAVMYFRRALKLDRHYLSAWTLMGHEYVEMKNTSAAIGML